MRNALIWLGVVCIMALPLIAAGFSPQLAWRSGVYILAGFAGILAMSLLFLQPLLAGRLLPNITPLHSRFLHRITGIVLVTAILAHVVGLWFTSAPDVMDALLFRSPTPFSAWGVVAMWAVFATTVLALSRRRLRLRTWRLAHGGLAIVIAVGSAVHAILIQGTMETLTKTALCGFVLLATVIVVGKLFAGLKTPKRG